MIEQGSKTAAPVDCGHTFASSTGRRLLLVVFDLGISMETGHREIYAGSAVHIEDFNRYCWASGNIWYAFQHESDPKA